MRFCVKTHVSILLIISVLFRRRSNERLWHTVKYDYVYLSPPENGWELYQGLKAFFERYNYQKHHRRIYRKLPVSAYYSSLASSARSQFST